MARRKARGPSLRDKQVEAEYAAKLEAEEAASPTAKKATKKTTKKKATKRKATKSRARKKVSERQRIVWAVFNNSNQQVAAFDYPEKDAAYKKVEELGEKGGPYFVQRVKEALVVSDDDTDTDDEGDKAAGGEEE